MRECEKVLDYFNDELSEGEKEQFERHLESCEDCREEIEELRSLTDDLPFSSEPVDPPEGMKDRVLGAVFAEEETEEKSQEEENVVPLEQHLEQDSSREVDRPTRSNRQAWLMRGLAAALVASLVGNVFALTGGEETVSEPPAVESTDQVNQRVSLEGESTPARASAAMIRQNGSQLLTLQAEQLEPLQGDEVYQVWLLNGDEPYRAGTFVANQNGEGAVAFSMDQLPSELDWDAVAISKEPNAQSQTPQGEVILSSSL
ncbi:anti-sigma factor [Halobacillus salinus]|uniref:Anti-sigma-W factor RsiW n=1 Tax=Halobacillus salinus TaxID=192814 RepID=A0A4Z0H0S2_9BACI|nr:anti-sigma factor [Halobacillus salinus]TGB02392.1 hypothetical protein E4663_13710 [Halobacillus salinus]